MFFGKYLVSLPPIHSKPTLVIRPFQKQLLLAVPSRPPFRNIFSILHSQPLTPPNRHTIPKSTFCGDKMKIVQVPALSDNYSYLVVDEQSGAAVAIDPAAPPQMIEAAHKNGARIEAVLTTHHHGDHAGGNQEMTTAISNLKVYGGDERVEALTDKVKGGDELKFGNLRVLVHFTPCHTSGHVLYQISNVLQADQPHCLFTGDTLFISGCGRFFEGNAQQMYHNLIEVIGKLPKETQIFCGHEYTVKNLEFAKTVDPHNKAVEEKLEWAKKQRASGLSTVPSTVGEEFTFNPFMRVHERGIAEAIGMNTASPVEIMAELRRRKDKF